MDAEQKSDELILRSNITVTSYLHVDAFKKAWELSASGYTYTVS